MLFILMIISYIYSLICIRFCNIIYETKFIKNQFLKDVILSVFLFIIFIFLIWTIRVDTINFVKMDFFDSYVGYDTIFFYTKTGIYIFLCITVAILFSNIVNRLYNNRIIYYLSAIMIFIVLLFYIYSNGIFLFDKKYINQYLVILLGVLFAYLREYLTCDRNKELESSKNTNNIIFKIVTIILFFVLISNIIKFTTSFYPTYLYEKVLINIINSGYSKNDVASIHSIKQLNYDNIKVGDTIQFGKREDAYSVKELSPIEWIVLDKDDNEKKLLLLSKNGLDIIRNYAVTKKLIDYDYYDSGYSKYEYDESNEDEFNFYNSALRYELYDCYSNFLDYNLSKEDDDEYNEYKYSVNILPTYLEDTNTTEKFFLLNDKEFDKYKKIDGVGNFYFINSNNYIIFNKEFRNLPIVLRDFREKNGVYDFKCVDSGYTASQYSFDVDHDYEIKNKNNYIGTPFWFSDVYTSEVYDNDLWHGFIDLVLRPAMWYKCE